GALVWGTPHTMIADSRELAAMGGSHHPLLGALGVMSAKNTAVNLMILSTFLSFLLYRRAMEGETVIDTVVRGARVICVPSYASTSTVATSLQIPPHDALR